MKNRIRLTESDLHRIVKQTVKRVLNEDTSYDISDYDDRKSLIFGALINGDEDFIRILLSDLSDSAIEEIYNIAATEYEW